MATYLLHYCFDELPSVLDDLEKLNNPLPRVQRHASTTVDMEHELEYVSDVKLVEDYLTKLQANKGNLVTNVHLLGWQRLRGEERPAEAV